MKLGIIGGGSMGEAIIGAVSKAGLADPDQICVIEPVSTRRYQLAKTYGVQATPEPSSLHDRDLILLAVKPQDFEKAAEPLKGAISETATAVSIMAGVTIARLRAVLDSQRVIRAMPNTPAQIGEGMTVWTATKEVPEEALAQAKSLFAAMGQEAFVPEERYLDMATGLSGSGPAYVFLFLEALIDAGVHVGLARELATTMALQTVIGSARYAQQSGAHLAELRNQVTSPGGTTAEGLRELEAAGFRNAVLEAVRAAYNKSRLLGGESK